MTRDIPLRSIHWPSPLRVRINLPV